MRTHGQNIHARAETDIRLGRSFRKTRALGPLYTGGPIAVDQTGTRVVASVGEDVFLTDISTGERICRFATVRFYCRVCSYFLLTIATGRRSTFLNRSSHCNQHNSPAPRSIHCVARVASLRGPTAKHRAD